MHEGSDRIVSPVACTQTGSGQAYPRLMRIFEMIPLNDFTNIEVRAASPKSLYPLGHGLLGSGMNREVFSDCVDSVCV